MRIRNCKTSDVAAIRRFVTTIPPLDLHSAFTYWAIFEYFSDLCFLAEEKATNQLSGFVTGLIGSTKKNICYLWQLGVAPPFRGTSCASQLVHCLVEAAITRGCTALQFSIEPSNRLSLNTAMRFAQRRGLQISTVGKVEIYDPVDEKGTHEILYEMALSKVTDLAKQTSST